MKYTKHYFLWIFILLVISKSSSQTNEEYNCQLNLNAALLYLTAGVPLPSEYQESITLIVGDCKEGQSNEAHLVKGIMQWKEYIPNATDSEAFKNVQHAALNGNSEAAFILGIFYKNGIGTPRDYSRAYNWFKASADTGNKKAEYAVGYFYLKGIAVDQDYQKAIDSFNKSDFIMAKHYLGICHFFGYGTTKDESKGMQILESNLIPNSEELLRSLEAGEHIYVPDNTVVPDLDYDEELPVSSSSSDRLYTGYEGKLIEYDWAGKEIKRTTPVELKLTYIPKDDEIEYYFSFVSRQRKGNVTDLTSTLVFGGLTLDDTKLYPDNPDEPLLRHRIPFADFELVTKQEQEYLIARITSEVLAWSKEPGAPRLLVLKKTDVAKPLLENNSDDEDFITVFPNPFVDNFTFSFGINGQFNGTAMLLGSNGNILEDLFRGEYLTTGVHNFQIDASTYSEGVYYIQLKLENDEGEEVHTKRILKN